MASQYDTNKAELVRQITAQKNIYKFRQFLYSLNRDIRQQCFDISKKFLENEYRNNDAISTTERERLLALINHWQWHAFDNTSVVWWSTLSFNHAKSISLMTMIHLWVDDIHTFDPEAFETSTDGLR
jgi:hypothetical protein